MLMRVISMTPQIDLHKRSLMTSMWLMKISRNVTKWQVVSYLRLPKRLRRKNAELSF